MASPEYVDRIIAENRAAMRQISIDIQAAVARQFARTIAIIIAAACASVVVACVI